MLVHFLVSLSCTCVTLIFFFEFQNVLFHCPPPLLKFIHLAAWIFVACGLLSGCGLGLDAMEHGGCQFSNQGSNVHPVHWRQILNRSTTRDIPQNVLLNSGIDLLPFL